MRTANERLEDLETRLAQLEREHIAVISSTYWAALTVLKSLHESKKINYIEKRLAGEMVEQSMLESLAPFPALLDHLKLFVFRARWRRQDG